jgi:hypothetical protein
MMPCLLEGLDVVPLGFQHLPEIGRKREHTAFVVLRGGRVQPNLPGLEVDVAPFERQDFARRLPPGDVGKRGHALKVLFEVVPDALELILFEESFPDVALLQLRDIRSRSRRQPARLNGQGEHPLQVVGLPVDLAIRGTLLLPMLWNERMLSVVKDVMPLVAPK